MAKQSPDPIMCSSGSLQVPDDVEIGDIIVARYEKSAWAERLPWEGWHHAALVVGLDPVVIMETPGKNNNNSVSEVTSTGPVMRQLSESGLWTPDSGILEARWLRPVFPDPIREKRSWLVPRILRKKITESEARRRAAEYATAQQGDDYSIGATKWDENEWYCSLLIFKSYSMTVTGMYLEDYGSYDGSKNDRARMRAGPKVTPEDLLDSKRTRTYFIWARA